MTAIAYYRVSSHDQTIASQRDAMQKAHPSITFEREFADEGVSGATMAQDRAGFSALLAFIREGDTLYVPALDRLGRDGLDVQQTVARLHAKGVLLNIGGLGLVDNGPAGKLILAVLAQVAEMERARIKERTAAGREIARETFERTGKTHKGKASLGGAPKKASAQEVAEWRKATSSSLNQTAAHFGISKATVARYLNEAQ
jgi:putative DNA-invertase from lambdoid prophage Rac